MLLTAALEPRLIYVPVSDEGKIKWRQKVAGSWWVDGHGRSVGSTAGRRLVVEPGIFEWAGEWEKKSESRHTSASFLLSLDDSARSLAAFIRQGRQMGRRESSVGPRVISSVP